MLENEDFAEVNDAESVKQFLPNGVRLGTSNDVNNGTPGQNLFIAWMWRAGGAAVANNDGDIAAQVSANRTAGFSIVGFQGISATATVGHGLSRAPEFMLLKNRQAAGSFWVACHSALDTSWTQATTITLKEYPNSLHLNNADAADTQPFITTAGNSNNNYIAYCWHGNV